MKKVIVLLFVVSAFSNLSMAQKKGTFFVGGTGYIEYTNYFQLCLEPVAGYEIKDWVAIGTGLGMSLATDRHTSAVRGVAEPFVRFTPWHNDLLYIDLKATAGFGFNKSLEIMQIGIRPSLRFRLAEHWDLAADIGMFGAQYSSRKWTPLIGITGISVGLWFAYRF